MYEKSYNIDCCCKQLKVSTGCTSTYHKRQGFHSVHPPVLLCLRPASPRNLPPSTESFLDTPISGFSPTHFNFSCTLPHPIAIRWCPCLGIHPFATTQHRQPGVHRLVHTCRDYPNPHRHCKRTSASGSLKISPKSYKRLGTISTSFLHTCNWEPNI